MPQDKDIKRLVRARMAETGERYTQAKAAVDTRSRSIDGQSRYQAWVDALGSNETRAAAYQSLKALPDDVLRTLAAHGTTHENWRIRRGCCQLLDDLAFATESLAALERCLDDPEPLVRRAALHSLSCQHCKPEGCEVDSRSVFERMATDPSRKVRKMVVTGLWVRDGDWVKPLLQRMVDGDPSDYVRDLARSSIERIERARRSDAERRLLPPDLVAKTERHRGRWVAISEGRIVGAGNRFRALSRRQRRGLKSDVREYWVAPSD
jgi:hypothetical protein